MIIVHTTDIERARLALAILAILGLAAACGEDPGNGSPCDGPEDCLPGLVCDKNLRECRHPCAPESCDVDTCETAAPAFVCPAPEDAP